MEITGTVIYVDTQTGVSKAGNEWRKKIFVIEYNEGTYTKHLAFEMFGDERITANPVEKNDIVTVQYSIESTEWNGRWFTTVSAWRVSQANALIASGSNQKNTTPEPIDIISNPSEDLPF